MSFSDPASIFASLFIGLIGFGIFRYGKSQTRAPQLVVGIIMMIYPYFVPKPLWMVLVAAALIGLLWLLTKLGY